MARKPDVEQYPDEYRGNCDHYRPNSRAQYEGCNKIKCHLGRERPAKLQTVRHRSCVVIRIGLEAQQPIRTKNEKSGDQVVEMAAHYKSKQAVTSDEWHDQIKTPPQWVYAQRSRTVKRRCAARPIVFVLKDKAD